MPRGSKGLKVTLKVSGRTGMKLSRDESGDYEENEAKEGKARGKAGPHQQRRSARREY